MTLTEFLLARIAEDEAAAQSATPAPWIVDEDGLVRGPARVSATGHEYHPQVCPGGGINYDEGPEPSDAAHIARHNPARVLAECEAKRGIVEWLGHTAENEIGWDGMDWFVLGHLAAIYADHPDYREEWRP